MDLTITKREKEITKKLSSLLMDPTIIKCLDYSKEDSCQSGPKLIKRKRKIWTSSNPEKGTKFSLISQGL